MPPPKPTLAMLDRDSTLRMAFYAFVKSIHAEEGYEFYYSKESNQAKYQKYIREYGPKQVNISYGTRAELDTLAQQQRWTQMNALMLKAKKEVATLMSSDSLLKFQPSDEYSRWYVTKYKKLTDRGMKAFLLLKKDLGIGKKETDLKNLMLIVEGGRTPADRKAAFLKINKMMKLTVKAATHFKAAGLAVP